MVSSEDIRVRMSKRRKTRLAVGKPGELTKFTHKDIPANLRIKVPFFGDNVTVTTKEGAKFTVVGNRLASMPPVAPVIETKATGTKKETPIDKLKKIVKKVKK